MANFNPKQKRDQRGRWQKRTFLEKAFTRLFPGNSKAKKPVAPYSTAGDDTAQERPAIRGTAETISEIKAEMEHLLTWIDPQGTGKFPRTVIKHIRRNLDKYETALTAGETLLAVATDSPRVVIIGETAEIEQFLPLIKGLPPGACKCLK